MTSATERAPLLPTTNAPPPAPEGIVSVVEDTDGRTSVSFLPILGLLIFGVGAGWIIGVYRGSFLWMVPCIALISGLAQRRIAHFKTYLLHAIIRTADKQRLDEHMETTEWINTILEHFWTVLEPELSRQVIEKTNAVLEAQKPMFIDKLVLKEFTLGSNAPSVLGARSYQRTQANIIVGRTRGAHPLTAV